MKLFVTGASSFVGSHFCTLAAAQGHTVVGLYRNTTLRLRGVTGVQAEVQHARPSNDTDVIVHLATKVMADDALVQNRSMLDAVVGWGKPVVYASSTVVHWERKNAYARSRVEDEARVEASGLPWLIVRPCAPYGPRHAEHQPHHKESFHTLARMCRWLPRVPVLGDGRYRRQPVHVDDFNGAILSLVVGTKWGAAYDAGGPEPMTLREIITRLGGRGVLPLPLPLLKLAGPLAGLHPDVLTTFDTDDVVDPAPLARASGITPRAFDPAALRNA